ncbi:transmembrane amino acid transporter protein-domain-containing protein [Aspergillus avenaceus]|uniref:Transmembrane amino acid transporter protein-domain-containing protein n=1 Tax=Aspergillus avenaceus TaxID=36643 RepID=A0A5N6U656_ASPAV|nr:transmembrane amino acid transporter protein-domain-containing protein [Aspergillus avenaceus]
MPDIKEKVEDLQPTPSQIGEVHEGPAYDAVFGEITEEGPNYRDVGLFGTVALMMKTQIGLGVLSIPAAFDALGLVPGVIVLLVIATITTWSDYMIGIFKIRHREIYGIDDVGSLIFGRIGREVFGFAFCIYWIFVAGSGMLGISIALNSVSTHGACTAIFVVVAAVVGGAFGSIQTLGRLSWLAWIGLTCILTSIFIVTIAVGVQDRPASAPQDGTWVPDYKIVAHPSFTDAISAVSSIAFAYAGTPAFFPIVSEMRDPRKYTRALLICQGGVTAVYITIGCVVYYYCGSYVASPALGSAGPTMKKIAYGFALPGLLVTTMLVIHLPGKLIFIRILRGSQHLTGNTVIHWVTWFGCTVGVTIIAYIIASAIPVFDNLISLIGALMGTFMSFQPMGCMWLYDNWTKGKNNVRKSSKWVFMVCWSSFVILAGCFLMVAGTYGSVVSIIDGYKADGGSAAWSCADNSNSV